jgi:very-short-patch-repair endonuclease
MNNKITCPICQRSLHCINATHLKNHNLTKEEFKIKYPNQKFMSEKCLNDRQKSANIRATHSYETTAIATKKCIADKVEKQTEIYNLNPQKCKNCNDILPYKTIKSMKRRKYCKKPECQYIAHSIGGKKASHTPRTAWKTNPKWLNHMGVNDTSTKQKKRFSSKGEKILLINIKEHFPQYKWQSGGRHNIGNNIYKSHDIYCKELQLILEYDGIYHFKNIYGNLLQVQQKDNQLEKWCTENKWKLIRINEKTFNKVPNILDKIYDMITNIVSLPTVNKLYIIPEI